jgi:hypothetical protein
MQVPANGCSNETKCPRGATGREAGPRGHLRPDKVPVRAPVPDDTERCDELDGWPGRGCDPGHTLNRD